MNKHHCLLCIGSNTEHLTHFSYARKALYNAFPDIRFSELMETEAIGHEFYSPFCNQLAEFTTYLPHDSICHLLKSIENHCGRVPEDKALGIVKLDIDLLIIDDLVLKPEDMKREYIKKGIASFK